MLDKKNPEDEPRQKRSFIREKVVKQPLTRKQILFRAGCVILAAAACGAGTGIDRRKHSDHHSKR